MAQRYEGEQNHVPHRLKGRDGGLLHRLNKAETRLKQVIELKNEAMLRGFANEEAVIALTNQLAAQEAKERELRTKLIEAQAEIKDLHSQLTQQQENSSFEQDKTLKENALLRDGNATLTLEVIKLRLDRDQQQSVNLELAADNAELSSANKLLRSQVGSLHALYGPGLPYTLFKVASKLPVIGQLFENAANASYNDFRQRKNQERSPKTR